MDLDLESTGPDPILPTLLFFRFQTSAQTDQGVS